MAPPAPSRKPAKILRADEIASAEQTVSHPWNPLSEITGTRLGWQGGLERTGVNRARVNPGKESFAYHTHLREEEWLYFLSGRAVLTIDGEDVEVGPGDFVAFPAPSVAHQLRNPFDEPVEYLMGGENLPFEVADFPELNRRMLRFPDRVEVYDLDAGRPLEPVAVRDPAPRASAASEEEEQKG
jgi:uncharacterized cupin superfamily protein